MIPAALINSKELINYKHVQTESAVLVVSADFICTEKIILCLDQLLKKI